MNATTENPIDLPHNEGRSFDPFNRAHIVGLADRINAKAKVSARCWERANDSDRTPESRATNEARHQSLMVEIDETLAALGIRTDWPGLYPSFTVARRGAALKGTVLPMPAENNGYSEHSADQAILGALGLPRNFLTA